MANVITPDMSLTLPGVGTEASPDWAVELNDNFSIIDGHDHSNGRGVPITPAGLNINADLSANNNNVTLLRSLRLSPQASPLSLPADLGCLYESGVDLWFNDGNGNQIRITQSGGVVGTPGSISGLTSPASATYVAGNDTFVWQSAVNTSADMDFGSAILRNDTVSSKGLTLSPPPAMAVDYTLVLPALPSVNSYLALDASGNITTAQPVAPNYQISSSCGGYTTNSGTYIDVTNLSITGTYLARPVFISMQSDGISQGSPANLDSGAAGNYIQVAIVRDSTVIANYVSGGETDRIASPGPLTFIDLPSAGTHTYKIQVLSNNGSTIVEVGNYKLVVSQS